VTPALPTDPQQKSTPQSDGHASPRGDISSFNEDTKDEEYMSHMAKWLALNSDWMRMLDNEMMMLTHHQSNMRNRAVAIFQQAVTMEPELFMETFKQITVAIYAIPGMLVQFTTSLGIISYWARSQGTRIADTEGGRRKWVRKEWEL